MVGLPKGGSAAFGRGHDEPHSDRLDLRLHEARIFRSKGETGPALTWLRQFVRPKVEDVKVKESIPVAKAHPGFKAVQNRIARKQGVSPARAGAMLAAGTRRASAGAKKANPRLKRVKG